MKYATYVAYHGDRMDYKEQSEIIKNSLNLTTEPVAIKLFEKESKAKSYLEKGDNILHCQAVITASKGKSFYSTSKELGCGVAGQILGLKEVKENLTDGRYFDSKNVTQNQEKGANLISEASIINEKTEAIGYMPLGKVTFKPDVIAIIAEPKQIYNIIRAHVYHTGKRLETSVSGTQSLCGDIVAKTIIENKINISYGCVGSHLATEFGSTDVAVGIPIDELEDICDALKIVKLPQ